MERVKWLAYVGAFFNKEYAANAVYAQVRNAYMSLRRDALAALGQPPLVCWVFKDWDGNYAMSYAPYKMEYITVRACNSWAHHCLLDTTAYVYVYEEIHPGCDLLPSLVNP